jgi:hypothetical protein
MNSFKKIAARLRRRAVSQPHADAAVAPNEMKASYYSDCSLPFERYIRATVYGDLSALVIAGHPLPDELETAWTAINSEFCELVGDPDTKSRHQQHNTALELSALLLRVSVLVKACRISADPRLIAALREEFEDVDFGTCDGADLEAALHQIEVEMTRHKIELQCIEAELNSMTQSKTEREPLVTEAFFYESLLEISHHEQRTIKAPEITARDYALLLKRLRRHYAAPRQRMPLI